MLVLTRKTHERIMIGDEVVLTVIHVGENKVKIGIEAPLEVKVGRVPADPPRALGLGETPEPRGRRLKR